MKLNPKFIRLDSDRRLYNLNIPVVGLTGGIASGKSTVSHMLRAQGLNVIDADKLVKDIYLLPEVVNTVQKKFPEVVENGTIIFPKLRQLVFTNKEIKSQIETLVYTHLPSAFHKAFSVFKAPELLIYDVPLLFEKNLEVLCDLSVLVYAPRKIQRSRLMTRDGHLESMADTILDQQMDIEEKKNKAEFIIDNSRTTAELTEEVKQFLRQILV